MDSSTSVPPASTPSQRAAQTAQGITPNTPAPLADETR